VSRGLIIVKVVTWFLPPAAQFEYVDSARLNVNNPSIFQGPFSSTVVVSVCAETGNDI
jgi:hypothetical protein